MENVTDHDRIEDQPNDGIVGNNSKDVVSHESFQKLLKQRKADQEKLSVAEQKLKRLEELEANESKLNDDKLKSEGNWKALLEARESKLKEYEARVTTLDDIVKGYEDKFTNAHKINAFKEAIGGSLKQNEYYSFVDVSKIALDPETGAIDDKSLKSYANEFVGKFKDLISFKAKSLPKDAGTTSFIGKKSPDQMTTTEIEAELRKLGNI